MNESQYWSLTLYYLVFALFDLGLAYLLVVALRHHIKTWPLRQGFRHICLLLVAGLLLMLASGALGFLFFATFEAWQAAIDPDTPAPLFELFWIAGLPVFSLLTAIAGVLQALVRKEFNQLPG